MKFYLKIYLIKIDICTHENIINSYNNKYIMTHNFSVCSPGPIGFCFNIDNHGNKSLNAFCKIGMLEYSYTPSINNCTTITNSTKTITTCPSYVSTATKGPVLNHEFLNNINAKFNLPMKSDKIFTDPSQLTPNAINDKLNHIENIINDVDSVINKAESIIRDAGISGVSSGDTQMQNVNIFALNRGRPIIDPIVYENFNLQEKDNLLNIVNEMNKNNNEITCASCGCRFFKQFLLDNDFYWCTMCSSCHFFSPYSIIDFGPFDSEEDMMQFNEKLTNTLNAVYNNHKEYWTN